MILCCVESLVAVCMLNKLKHTEAGSAHQLIEQNN
jgi:hypothetical protein